MFSELLDEEKYLEKCKNGRLCNRNYDIDLVNESKLRLFLKEVKYAYNNAALLIHCI
jgi:hypothetical protein